MSESIYAPPEADVTAPGSDEDAQYYVVGTTKFLLLSILTFTLYFVYWFYRNWKLVNLRENDAYWPAVRGFFFIFFTHSLLNRIDDDLKLQERDYSWSPGAVATLFVVVTLIGNVANQFIPIDRFPIISVLTPFVSTVLTAFLLLPAQKAANAASDDPDGSGNARLTAANWAWILLGGLFWLLNLVGLAAIIMGPGLQ